jgi:hypothetical protein
MYGMEGLIVFTLDHDQLSIEMIIIYRNNR